VAKDMFTYSAEKYKNKKMEYFIRKFFNQSLLFRLSGESQIKAVELI
jgi:hypothetical protein